MKNTVLGELYSCMDSKELRQLDLYMSTSNWQYSETIVKCHEIFHTAVKEGTLSDLTKEIIFQYIYDEEKYTDNKLRFVFNRLIEAIREHIVLLQNKEDNVFTQKIWMDFLAHKKLKKNLTYNVDKQSKAHSSEYKFLSSYFKSQEESVQLFSFSKDIKRQYRSMTDIMKKAELFSDLVFIRNYCSLISFSNLYQSIPFDLPIHKMDEIKAKHWEKENPEFQVYLSVIDLLINKDVESYYNYKRILFANFELWEDEEKVNFLLYLLNFSTNQINKGEISFIDEQYELFNYFEENNYFLLDSYLNQGRINNVIHIYLRKKDTKRAEEFINKYVNYLEEENRESCKHFNLSRILFENRTYRESLRELLQVDFSQDPFYSLNSKLLLLKNYFELNESDAFDSLCSSFKEFIRKNKVISNDYKTYYLNFIKTIKKLYQATPSRLKSLNRSILDQKQIAEKNWLLEKTQIQKSK